MCGLDPPLDLCNHKRFDVGVYGNGNGLGPDVQYAERNSAHPVALAFEIVCGVRVLDAGCQTRR